MKHVMATLKSKGLSDIVVKRGMVFGLKQLKKETESLLARDILTQFQVDEIGQLRKNLEEALNELEGVKPNGLTPL